MRTNNGTTALFINSSEEVGIGTSSPSQLLDVASPIRIAPAALPGTPVAGDLAFDSGASNALKFYNGTAWQTVGTGTGTGDFLKNGTIAMTGNFNAGGNEVIGNTTASANLTLESTRNTTKGYVSIQPNGGNVGIGTTSPVYKLTVEASAGGFPATILVNRDFAAGTTGSSLLLNIGATSGNTNSTVQASRYR
jgi:trimeric autotransporter adhesin